MQKKGTDVSILLQKVKFNIKLHRGTYLEVVYMLPTVMKKLTI